MNYKNSKTIEKAIERMKNAEEQWLKRKGLFPNFQKNRKNFSDEEINKKIQEERKGNINEEKYVDNMLDLLSEFPIYSIIFPFKILQYTDEDIDKFINTISYPGLLEVKNRKLYEVNKKLEKVRILLKYCKTDKGKLTRFVNESKLKIVKENGFNKDTREKVIKPSLEHLDNIFTNYYVNLENKRKYIEKLQKKLEAEKENLEKENEVKNMNEGQFAEEVIATADVNTTEIFQGNPEDTNSFTFREITDLDKCKEIALNLLGEPVTNLLTHPMFGYTYARRGNKQYNLKQNPSIVKIILKEKKEKIKILEKYIDFTEVFEISSQQIEFLEKTKSYIDQNDYSKFLRRCFFTIPYHNEYHKIALDYLKKAKKEYLMTSNELENYSNLENSVTVYKSLKGKDDVENLNSLDWYLDYEVARKNADRIRPYIYKVKIDKDNIFIYYSGWKEITIIIDFTKIYDLEFVEEIIFSSEETIKKQRVISIARDEIDKIMKVDLSICNEEIQLLNTNKGKQFISENEKIISNFNYLNCKVKELENLRGKIQRRRNKAFEYLQERRINENFKKIAYLECLRYLNRIYINQIKCITKPLFLYNRELLKVEIQKKKLELKDKK